MARFCTKCGHKNADGAAFCESCGEPLAAKVPPTANQQSGPGDATHRHQDALGTMGLSATGSENWECLSCKALNPQDQNTCWNCKRPKGAPAIDQAAASPESPWGVSRWLDDESDRQLKIAIAIVGGLIFLFGLVRFNSMESQLVRGFGGRDVLGVFMLIGGGLLTVLGAYPLMGSRVFKTGARSPAPESSAGGGTSATASPNPPANAIEQLERLAALKDRGILSAEEFEEQKKKLLA